MKQYLLISLIGLAAAWFVAHKVLDAVLPVFAHATAALS